MQEASWVRSVYLYLMCGVSVALIAIGALGSISGVVHAAAPDLGHRDELDRVGIGVSNIGTKVVDLFDDAQGGGAEDFCRDVTDNVVDFEDCMADEVLGPDSMGAIRDGISEVRSELQDQIRNSSFNQLIRGILLMVAGLLLFRIHGPRTELFANGLMPKRVPGTPDAPPPPPPAAPESAG